MIDKRQREQAHKDKLRAKDARREDRRQRAAQRAATGEVGPPMGEPEPPIGDLPGRPQAEREPPPWKDESSRARLFVGNLSFDVTADMLRELFAEQGPVVDVHVMTDRDTGRPRGFAFVTMGTVAAATTAIRELHGRSLDNRDLRVSAATERTQSSGGARRR